MWSASGKGGDHTGGAFDDMPIGALPANTGNVMRFTGTTVLKLFTEEVGLDDGVTALRQLGLIPEASANMWQLSVCRGEAQLRHGTTFFPGGIPPAPQLDTDHALRRPCRPSAQLLARDRRITALKVTRGDQLVAILLETQIPE